MAATLTPEDREGLTADIVKALDAKKVTDAADSAVLAATAAKAKNIRTIVGAVVALVGLIAAGTLAVHELQEKPTTEQVDEAIEVRVSPLEGAYAVNAEADKAAKDDLRTLQADVDRVQSVQDYQIQNSAWQGDVLQHIAAKKRTKPPPKPESLKAKERELLSR